MMYVWLLIGFVLLIKGADFFVDGSSSVAVHLRVPTIIIGLTVVAFGTSMPEASVSITAAMQGRNGLAVSNVIGSNIFNTLVVLGASALVAPVRPQRGVMRREYPFSILMTGLLILFMMMPFQAGRFAEALQNKETFSLGRLGGLVLLGFFVWYVVSAVKSALAYRRAGRIVGEPGEDEIKPLPPLRCALYILGGLAGIIYGGDRVVSSASAIARAFGLSETFIGLTIVALGTSLPELVTSVVASKKGANDLAVGNVIGSNIFNILLILGASSAIHPIKISGDSVCDAACLLLISIVTYLSARGEKGITRKEGILFLAMYGGYFAYILGR